MKFFSYIKYFFFLAVNWNTRIAWYMIKGEIAGEKKYGIQTTGADELHALEKLGIDISHATIYMPVSYPLLEEVFNQLESADYKSPARPGGQHTIQHSSTHFLDIGCGKGRALCVAAHYGFKRVSGLDFSKELCEIATKNLSKTKQKIPDIEYKIIHNDAFYFEIPDEVNCIFFFNPFDEMIMSGVVKNIRRSLKMNPRKIDIIYVNPLHKELFLEAGFTETWYSKKMKYLEASILQNK